MKKVYALVLLVVAAFALRAAVFCGYLAQDKRYWQVDTTTYVSLAKELAENSRFATSDGTPNAYRLPGYPLFLATIFKSCGVSYKVALWVQIILASFIPLLVFFLASILFPWRRRVAWGAAVVTTVHLGYVMYAGFMMTETLFVLCFLLFLIPFCRAVLRDACDKKLHEALPKNAESEKFYNRLALNPAAKGTAFVLFYDDMFEQDVAYSSYVRGCDDTEGLEIFFAGMMLGLASLVRPVGHYLLAVAAVVLFFSGRHRLSRFAECAILGAGWFIIVGGWLVRNALLFGHVFFHTLPGGHFLYLSAARVVAAEEKISYHDARAQLRSIIQEREADLVAAKGRKLDQYEVCLLHEQLAKQTFLHAPVTALKFWAQDMMRATLSLYSAELLYLESGRKQVAYFATGRPIKNWFMRYLQPQTEKVWLKFLIWAEMLFHALLLFGCAFFCWQSLFGQGHRGKKVLWAVLPFIILFIVIALSGGYARMRLPMEFLMIILACNFLREKHVDARIS
jgi:hypothetical protein